MDPIGSKNRTAMIVMLTGDPVFVKNLKPYLPPFFPVVNCPDVEQAWGFLKENSVALIVVDMMVPHLNHLALVRAARQNEATQEIPFLFVLHPELVWPELSAGGKEKVKDGWISLPCPTNQFRLLVQGLLRASNLRRGGRPGVGQAGPADPLPQASKRQEEEKDEAEREVFSGKIGFVDVPMILSMLEPLRLTGQLEVKDGEKEGIIFVVESVIWHAEIKDIQGPDALFLLFHIRKGCFRFLTAPPVKVRTIVSNTTMLLLEGLRQMDGAKEAIKQFQERRRVVINPKGNVAPLPTWKD